MLAFSKSFLNQSSFPVSFRRRGTVFLASFLIVANSPAQSANDGLHGFETIQQLLSQTVIDRREVERVWQVANYRDLLARFKPFEALSVMMSRFSTSHTAAYTTVDPEFFDLRAIQSSLVEPAERRDYRYPKIGAFYARDYRSGTEYSIAQVLPGSSAALVGLRAGDRIISADGKPFSPIASFMVGAGRQVVLKIHRGNEYARVKVDPDFGDPLDYYDNLRQKSISVLVIGEKRIGYVQMLNFFRQQDMDFLKREIRQGALKGITALVLDLRGAWGATPVDFAIPFLGVVPEMDYIDSAGFDRHSGWSLCIPLVLVTDRTTRSGKELFASVLQRNGATVVGQPTAGQVLSTRPLVIEDGKLLLELPYLHVAVNGRSLEGIGVTPDVKAFDGNIIQQAYASAAVALAPASCRKDR